MYNKLFEKILDSSIWLEPSSTRIVWLTFIAVMDERGFVQFAAVGNVANRARVTMEEAQAAIVCLESADAESSDPENEGRRIERVPGGWIVLNAEKHRALVTRAVKQEQTRLRVQKHREKKRNSNASVTPSEARSETESEGYQKKEIETREPESNQSVYQVSSTAKPVKPQPLSPRRRRDAAWEGPRVYVPQRLHADLLGLRQGTAGSDVERELWTWYSAVSEEWTAGSRRTEEPGADMFVFWRARYAERWPAKFRYKPTPRAVASMPTRAAWRTECAEQSHDPPCPTPERHELRKVVAETCQHWGVCESLAECQAKGGG